MQTYIRPASTLLLFTGLALIASAQQAPAPAPAAPAAPPPPMGFFITSENPGKGGDLGGLAGADAHCQKLATAVGAGSRTWRAYLSTPAGNGKPAVHARDRIGSGPWHNAKGELIARNVAELHGDLDRDRNNIQKGSALNEKGEQVSGRGDTPNRHDILTGSDSIGRAIQTTAAAAAGPAAPPRAPRWWVITTAMAAATPRGIPCTARAAAAWSSSGPRAVTA